MSRPAAVWFWGSERWIREAENERLHNRPRMAKACMQQHVIWRAHARKLAKQAEEKKP